MRVRVRVGVRVRVMVMVGGVVAALKSGATPQLDELGAVDGDGTVAIDLADADPKDSSDDDDEMDGVETMLSKNQYLDTDNFSMRERLLLVARTLLIYSVLAFITSCRDESLPLWMMTDVEHNGLGWDTSQIGTFLSTRGIFILVVQSIYVPYARKHGAVRCLRVGVLLYTPSLLIVPLVSLLAKHVPVLVWPMAICMGLMTTLGASFAFTSINCLINAAAGRELSGRVNGVAAACASTMRAIGPLLAAPLFAWSANNGLAYPLDTSFVFGCTAVVLLVLYVLTRIIPKNLN